MDRQALQERFGILGDSAALRRVLDRVRQVAPPDITVLLEGESGVGKELIATAIHGLSGRRHKRIVVVNCGAIPEGLIESELFGAEKGAYTGATERRTGYFEEADGGTLFLDEIGEMPLQAQVRLLRVLESGQFSRVGGTATLRADVRVIAATNKDLAAEVGAGRFREDLYYRLSAVVLRIPPLRERRDDIVPLFEAFVARFVRQYDAPPVRLSSEAEALLTGYAWPGNVRELRNVAEQTVVLAQGGTVSAEALRPHLRGVSAGLALARRAPAGGDELRERELVYRALLELRAEMQEVRAALRSLGATESGVGGAFGGPSLSDIDDALEVAYEPPDAPPDAADTVFEVEDAPRGFDRDYSDGGYDRGGFRGDLAEGDGAAGPSLPDDLEGVLATGLPLPTREEAEAALIREGLRRFDGNRRQTAEALGISERTLYRKIKDIEG